MRIILILLVFLCSQVEGANRRIALVLHMGWHGEKSVAYRMEIACKNLGWECEIMDYQNIKAGNYDFSISLIPQAPALPECKNYVLVSPPLDRYLTKKHLLKPFYSRFNGYLLCFPPQLQIKKERPFARLRSIDFYPSAHRRPYRVVNPTHLFHICSCWGNRAADKKFLKLFQLLDEEPYIRFYGNEKIGRITLRSCLGRIPYEGEDLLDRMSEAGVTLIFHSTQHNSSGTPSGRIFEAAAASTVIISDRNKFVQEQFGDAVLYIDTRQSADSILEQIRTHMSWIQTHPAQALEMAQRAYQVYLEKFTLEDQLLKLEAFHER